MWEVDQIPTGPGLVKRHGRLDTNFDSPANPLPKPTAADAGKVPTVGTGGVITYQDPASYFPALTWGDLKNGKTLTIPPLTWTQVRDGATV